MAYQFSSQDKSGFVILQKLTFRIGLSLVNIHKSSFSLFGDLLIVSLAVTIGRHLFPWVVFYAWAPCVRDLFHKLFVRQNPCRFIGTFIRMGKLYIIRSTLQHARFPFKPGHNSVVPEADQRCILIMMSSINQPVFIITGMFSVWTITLRRFDLVRIPEIWHTVATSLE